MRAVVLFFIALTLIRVAGMRSFGRKSSFDTVIVIMLGALLSRPVVGASPFGPTILAGAIFVVLHRILGVVTSRVRWLEKLVKGVPQVVYSDGRTNDAAMVRAGISVGDLDETARSRARQDTHCRVPRIVMETSGELSVVEE
jgi:uncharacterized membrane protein YcaP (DUF421 family)